MAGNPGNRVWLDRSATAMLAFADRAAAPAWIPAAAEGSVLIGSGPGRPARRGWWLASTSLAAVLIGGGAPPAFAACVSVNANFDNPSASTAAGVCVTNTSFTGNITNEGTISPLGIVFTNGTITGFIASTGAIVGGISLDSQSKITATNTAIAISGTTFAGGITNSGSISAHLDVRVTG